MAQGKSLHMQPLPRKFHSCFISLSSWPRPPGTTCKKLRACHTGSGETEEEALASGGTPLLLTADRGGGCGCLSPRPGQVSPTPSLHTGHQTPGPSLEENTFPRGPCSLRQQREMPGSAGQVFSQSKPSPCHPPMGLVTEAGSVESPGVGHQ